MLEERPAAEAVPADEAQGELPSFLADEREPLEVPRVLEDRAPSRRTDDLDLPDFLKNP